MEIYMAGLVPSFATGSNLAIYLDGKPIAFATNLSFSDSVPHAAIGGIGSYSYSALEPLAYTVNGSFSITRYSHLSIASTSLKPSRVRESAKADPQDGNSMLMSKFFNPLALMLSKTFDIVVYERLKNGTLAGAVDTGSTPIFKIEDCRLTDYSIGFTPGSVVSENIGFIGLRVSDLKAATAPAASTSQSNT
jgi:hypothetical protein